MPEAPASSPAPARRPSRARAIIIAVVAAAVAVWLAHFLWHLWHYERTDDAYVSGHVHQVASQADGQVAEVLVRENQTVKAGQVLVRLDPVPFDIAVAKAQADLARAQAQAAQAQAEAAQAAASMAADQADSAQAAAQLRDAEDRAALAKIDLDRDRRMSVGESRAVTPAELDTAQAAEEEAEAAVGAAKANVEAKRAGVAAAVSQRSAAGDMETSSQAEVAAAKAGVRDAERRRSYADIAAPADGRVGAKNVEVGNRVQTGQTLLVVVEPVTWIEANFKETQLARMRAGQEATVTIDAIPGRTFLGHVDSFAPASGAEFALLPPDNATGNFTKVVQRVPVRIILDPASVGAAASRLLPGLSAIVDVKVR